MRDKMVPHLSKPSSFMSVSSSPTPRSCSGTPDAITTYAGVSTPHYLDNGCWQFKDTDQLCWAVSNPGLNLNDGASGRMATFISNKEWRTLMSQRNLAYIFAGLGTLLLLLANLDLVGASGLLTIISVVLFVIALVLYSRGPVAPAEATTYGEPSLANWLFNDTRSAMLWLPIRLWLGWQWIEASLHKIGDPKWVTTGEALKGFWAGAVKIPDTGRPAIAYDWYRSFLQFMLDNQWYTWFAKLIAYGEFLIGVALIIGAFVGVAAFFGALMNWNFIMAGSASTNGLLFTAALLLVLAWKVGGYMGVDRWLLPALGVPWHRGRIFTPEPAIIPKPATG
jgi:thiosulfate dehydrogenase [quinone] large subunit